MTDEEREKFIKHCEWASEVVKSWPTWKQNVLGWSMRAQRDTPRKPIDNTKEED